LNRLQKLSEHPLLAAAVWTSNSIPDTDGLDGPLPARFFTPDRVTRIMVNNAGCGSVSPGFFPVTARWRWHYLPARQSNRRAKLVRHDELPGGLLEPANHPCILPHPCSCCEKIHLPHGRRSLQLR